MPKSFLTFDEQIAYLETKNLLIPDHERAKELLKRIGYFSLVSGYKMPFKNTTTKKYADGTRLEDIAALYFLDEDLRELFLKYILKIERNMRALLAYFFSQKHGEGQTAYLNPQNYATTPKNREAFAGWCLRLTIWPIGTVTIRTSITSGRFMEMFRCGCC